MPSEANSSHRLSGWLAEALDAENPGPPRTLKHDLQADVCIVGGGFTGLWSAIEIKTARPDAEVVLIERELCGSGASGRNGGFVLSLWAKFESLAKMCGHDEALRLCQQSSLAILDLQAFCLRHGIDAEMRLDGWLWAATSNAQIGAWESTVNTLASLNQHPFEQLAADQVAQRSGSAQHLAGVYEAVSASVQPAKLARGLMRHALGLGVKIFEHSPMLRLQRDQPAIVHCAQGRVQASRVILAMNAWSAQFAELRKAFVLVSSDVVMTRPMPSLLHHIGWHNGMTISDCRMLVHYYRTTPEGCLVFGKGGGSEDLIFGGNLGTQLDGPSQMADTVIAHLQRIYPAVQKSDIATHWTGPIDRTRNGLPHFGALPHAPHVFYAIGYSGNGVGPSMLGGKILAALALRLDNEWARCGLVKPLRRDFPPEPMRYWGGRLVRHAVGQMDLADDLGQPATWLARQLSRLAPAGLAPTGTTRPDPPSPT